MNKIKLEDVKKVFPNMNFLVLATEEVNLDSSPAKSIGENVRIFSASTLTSESDIIQASIVLATDDELRELFKLLLKLSEDMISNPEVQGYLEDIRISK